MDLPYFVWCINVGICRPWTGIAGIAASGNLDTAPVELGTHRAVHLQPFTTGQSGHNVRSYIRSYHSHPPI